MNKEIYYLRIDKKTSHIVSVGATFKEFMAYIPEKPEHMLLLHSQFWAGQLHDGLSLEYVDQQTMDKLINDQVYDYGDFAWADYAKEDSLDQVSPQELAELLYVAHRHEPLTRPFFSSLQNQYIYLAHDDEYSVKVYMKDTNQYRHVIEGKLIKAMKGRRSYMEPIPSDIMDILMEGAESGLVFDFPEISRDHKEVFVNVYKLTERSRSYDLIHKDFDRMKDCMNQVWLSYKRGKWTMTGAWK